MSEKDGGPAFPWGEHGVRLGGMSMRDVFAAAALPIAMEFAESVAKLNIPVEPRANAARIAYEQADAMLAERAK